MTGCPSKLDGITRAAGQGPTQPVTVALPSPSRRKVYPSAERVGITETAALAEPEPTLLTARSFTEYAVPLVSPLTTIGEVVASLAIQLVPPSSEYS